MSQFKEIATYNNAILCAAFIVKTARIMYEALFVEMHVHGRTRMFGLSCIILCLFMYTCGAQDGNFSGNINLQKH